MMLTKMKKNYSDEAGLTILVLSIIIISIGLFISTIYLKINNKNNVFKIVNLIILLLLSIVTYIVVIKKYFNIII